MNKFVELNKDKMGKSREVGHFVITKEKCGLVDDCSSVVFTVMRCRVGAHTIQDFFQI